MPAAASGQGALERTDNDAGASAGSGTVRAEATASSRQKPTEKFLASWLKNSAAIAGAGAAFAGLGTAAVRRVLHAPFPETSGTVRVSGIRGVVTIDRDVWGIPHIIASHY